MNMEGCESSRCPKTNALLIHCQKEKDMGMQPTLMQALSKGADAAVALVAPSTPPLSFQALREQIRETVVALNGIGIGRDDRIAIVLPNGPWMATAFLGVAAAATSAPLNPGYRADEFDFYLTD